MGYRVLDDSADVSAPSDSSTGGFHAVDDGGIDSDQHFGILQRTFQLPAAANREAVRAALSGKDVGKAYQRGASAPSSSERFQDEILRNTNDALDSLVGKLPEGPQTAIRFAAGAVPSAIGVAADTAVNPGEILIGMATGAATKGLSRLADPTIIPDNPNFLNTILKGNKFFSEAPSELASKATDAFTRGANYIKASFGKIKSGNSETFGNILDKIPSQMTRSNGDSGLTDALYKTLDYYGKDPNTVNTPGYQAVKKALAANDVNTADVTAATNKQAVYNKLLTKQKRGDFVDPDELEAYKLTPEDKAAIRDPRHADDKIEARSFQEVRREIRKSAGTDPLSKAVADGFDMEIGHNLSQTQPGLQDALTEYRPVLQAKYRALQKFKPNDMFDTGGERFLRGMAVDDTGGPKGKISDTDMAFMETLANGKGPYQGVGSGGLDALQEGSEALAKANKIKSLHSQNVAAKVGLGTAVTGLGLFKARLLAKLLGHG